MEVHDVPGKPASGVDGHDVADGDRADEDGPAGTAYSDVRQLFMSSQIGVRGRTPPAAARGSTISR